MHSFKELKVWQAAMEISKAIFIVTRSFPQEEKFTLVSQMMRCAISIPSNIAEGCGRKSNKEFYQYLNISLGSSFELETQLILAKEFGYISEMSFAPLQFQIIEVQRMLAGLQRSLNT
ncbi:MAG: four helix bundle protein [Sphingobacteriaceae bacterium]